MKSVLRYSFLLTVCLVTHVAASAHAVFIETSLQGTRGKAHTVKVVYGEPDEHEPIAKWWWYKDGTEVKCVLTKADGSTENLTLTAQENALVATFTPDRDGEYHVAIQHETERRPGAKSQYQINAHASIHVGKSKPGSQPAKLSNALYVYPGQAVLKTNKEVALVLYEHGKPAANAFFYVIAPTGWQRVVETDAQGVARFVPEWRGKYYAEGSKKEKVTGEAFEEYNRATTMSFEVN